MAASRDHQPQGLHAHPASPALAPPHPLYRGYFNPLYRGYFTLPPKTWVPSPYGAGLLRKRKLPTRVADKYGVMRLRKYHPHKSALFVTFSLEEGLFLLANPLCRAIVTSCLGGAQALYPVTICHFLVQATHVHMLLVVDSPDDVKDFVRHFKTESAHLINGLLGRNKRTLWCEGYDSPNVLTISKVKSEIAYLYTNPVKDYLIESIDLFPGVNSWKMFLRGEHERTWKRIRRPAVRKLHTHSLRLYSEEAERLLTEANTTHTFRIEPNAWMPLFGITDPQDQEAVNKEIIQSIKDFEEQSARERKRTKRSVMGRETLLSRVMDPFYQPNRNGKRTACLSDDIPLRVQFIQLLKGLYAQAKEVTERWKIGDFSVSFPPGLYPPSMPKLAEPLAAW